MIRRYAAADFEDLYAIINDGAEAYRGVIPLDCWSDPYMSRDKLQREIDSGVLFSAFEQSHTLVGVMGVQPVRGVTLIRHAYVLTAKQGQGIGGRLLTSLTSDTPGAILIGAWADATWAIRFYRQHGFQTVTVEQKTHLLRTYWTVPDRQIETSVVLANSFWRDQHLSASLHS